MKALANAAAVVGLPLVLAVLPLAWPLSGSFAADADRIDVRVYVWWFQLVYQAMTFCVTYSQLAFTFPALPAWVVAALFLSSVGAALVLYWLYAGNALLHVLITFVHPVVLFGFYLAYALRLYLPQRGPISVPLASPDQQRCDLNAWDADADAVQWHPLRQYVCVLVSTSVGFNGYYFCQELTASFSRSNEDDDMRRSIVGFVFQAGMAVLVRLAQFLGGLVEGGVRGFEVDQAMIYMCHVFYYAFYRQLFEKVHSPLQFVALQAGNLALEVLQYIVLTRPLLWNGLQRLRSLCGAATGTRQKIAWRYSPTHPFNQRRSSEFNALFIAADPGLEGTLLRPSHVDLAGEQLHRLALYNTATQYALRVCALTITTTFTLLLHFAVTRLPYLRKLFRALPGDRNDSGTDEELQFAAYLGIAVALELTMFGVVDAVYRVQYGISALHNWLGFVDCYTHRVFMVFIATHICQDVLLARLDVDAIETN